MNASPPQRILVRGVNWLGDAVMTTPALRRLRERFPEAQITLLTRWKLVDLWKDHPAINSMIVFRTGEKPSVVARRLREEKFDCALILPNSTRSALEAWLARIPRRIGYRGPLRNWLLTQAIVRPQSYVPMRKRSEREVRRLCSEAVKAVPPRPTTPESSLGPEVHHIHHYLHLAASLGANPAPQSPTLAVSDAEVQAVLARFGLSSATQVIGLNAGAEYGPAKRWPADRFIATAVAVQRWFPGRCIILGGKPEMDLAGEITDGLTRALKSAWPQIIPERLPANVAGQTSLRELMALLKFCRVVLTNDTGPMHVAAALGTPVVVPFGSTSPELTGPGLPGDSRHQLIQGKAPCAPCFLRRCPIDFRCMESISVQQVSDAILRLLQSPDLKQ